LLSVAACLVGVLLAAPELADAERQQAQQSAAVDVNNRSPQLITRIYLSPVGHDEWGRNRLGDRALGINQRESLNPGIANGCFYDVRVVYADQRSEEKRNQNLCELSEITFNGPAEIDTVFYVVNRSNRAIHFLYVSATGSKEWGRDWLGSDVTLAPGRRTRVSPGSAGGCNYDIRVEYDTKASEERRNQNLCELTEVVFLGTGTATTGNAAPGAAAAPSAHSFGTGFFVTADGYALTNHHVIEDCGQVAMLTDRGALVARVIRRDERNDLALLRVDNVDKLAFAPFRASPSIRSGDGVVVPGFPLPTVLQNGLNVTVGNVSALAGVGGNTALLQMTAPVQPGNSGGPLLDMSGNVVGVVVGKLDALGMAKQTGDIPQNVNFAVQGGIARLFLEAQGIRATEKPAGSVMAVGDVVDGARASTFQVECRR
jgi:S1-C subfamily serine protease